MKNNDEIYYQLHLLEELFQTDMSMAFNLALVRIESLEKCFSNAMFLFNEAMNDNKQTKSIISEIEDRCKKDLSEGSSANSMQIISIINRKIS